MLLRQRDLVDQMVRPAQQGPRHPRHLAHIRQATLGLHREVCQVVNKARHGRRVAMCPMPRKVTWNVHTVASAMTLLAEAIRVVGIMLQQEMGAMAETAVRLLRLALTEETAALAKNTIAKDRTNINSIHNSSNSSIDTANRPGRQTWRAGHRTILHANMDNGQPVMHPRRLHSLH